jgi:hypothetical protein
MVDTDPKLRFPESPFPMTSLDLCFSIGGGIALIAGIAILTLGASEVLGSSLVGLGVALVPMAFYTAHERRGQDEHYADQIRRLSGLDFVVDPPRMAQIASAAEMGKTMFAQSGPNVPQAQITEFTAEMRLSALALGGSVPAVVDLLLEQGLWPRRLFTADGSPVNDPSGKLAKQKIEHSISSSIDHVVAKAFVVGWNLQLILSLAGMRAQSRSDRVQALTDVIFEPGIADELRIVSRGSNLGSKVCQLTEETISKARDGRVSLEDLVSFLIFLQWYTASLSRAYPWDPWYATAIVRTDELLDELQKPSSAGDISATFNELAGVLAI